jgi:hypothetical protein
LLGATPADRQNSAGGSAAGMAGAVGADDDAGSDSAPIDHVWLTSADSNFLRSSIMMHANARFEPNTTYRMKITGTYVGGALEREWTFTTGAGNRF